MSTASLHVVTSDARRGAESFAVDLAEHLEELGHRARVVALTPSGMSAVHELRTLGRSRRSVGTLGSLRLAARGAQVVVAHGSATLEACAVGLAGSRVPFIYRTIGEPSYWVASGWRRRGVGWMLRRAARNVVLWPGAADYLASAYSIPRGRIDVIPNAVVAARFPAKTPLGRRRARRRHGLAEDRPCLAYVGSLSPEKDVGTLVQALRHWEDAQLLCAGDGPEAGRLRALADGFARDRVRFLGAVADPHDVYLAADLLVLPSLTEGMPAVVIEAGLVGTPTMATSVGAVPEMIEDGVTGFLVPPRDPELLASTLVEALPSAEEVGRRARAVFVRRYTMASVAPLWADVLEEASR